MKFRAFAFPLIAAAALIAAPASAAVSLQASAACGTSCFGDSGTFVQTLRASGFDRATQISSLVLDRSLLGQYGDRTFKITFWTADGEVQLGGFGAFNIAGLIGDQVTLSGPGFLFDPSGGDLMVKIELTNFSTGSGGGGFFGGGGGGGAMSFGGGGGGPQALNLPTGGFSTETPAFVANMPALVIDDIQPNVVAVPEPATWALMIFGFGAAGAMLRRREKVAVRV